METQNYCPHHKNVCKILRLCGENLRSFSTNLPNLQILLFFIFLVLAVSRDFHWLVHVKSWKKPGGVQITSNCFQNLFKMGSANKGPWRRLFSFNHLGSESDENQFSSNNINTSSKEHVVRIFNNYSSSPNGLWVNNPWGWRPNGLLI